MISPGGWCRASTDTIDPTPWWSRGLRCNCMQFIGLTNSSISSLALTTCHFRPFSAATRMDVPTFVETCFRSAGVEALNGPQELLPSWGAWRGTPQKARSGAGNDSIEKTSGGSDAFSKESCKSAKHCQSCFEGLGHVILLFVFRFCRFCVWTLLDAPTSQPCFLCFVMSCVLPLNFQERARMAQKSYEELTEQVEQAQIVADPSHQIEIPHQIVFVFLNHNNFWSMQRSGVKKCCEWNPCA